MARLPIISGQRAVKVFAKAGWKTRWQVGSHVTMEKEGKRATLSIPQHRELGRGLLRALIRDAGLTVNEFVAFLRDP